MKFTCLECAAQTRDMLGGKKLLRVVSDRNLGEASCETCTYQELPEPHKCYEFLSHMSFPPPSPGGTASIRRKEQHRRKSVAVIVAREWEVSLKSLLSLLIAFGHFQKVGQQVPFHWNGRWIKLLTVHDKMVRPSSCSYSNNLHSKKAHASPRPVFLTTTLQNLLLPSTAGVCPQ